MLRPAGTTVEWWIDQHRQLGEWLSNHPEDPDEVDRRLRRFFNDVETNWFSRRRSLPPCVAGRAVPVDGYDNHLTIGLFEGKIRLFPISPGRFEIPDWWGGGRSQLWYRTAGDINLMVFLLIADLLVAVEVTATTARL